jgi:hypothetical protein
MDITTNVDDHDKKEETPTTITIATTGFLSRKSSESENKLYIPEVEAIQQLRKRLPNLANISTSSNATHGISSTSTTASSGIAAPTNTNITTATTAATAATTSTAMSTGTAGGVVAHSSGSSNSATILDPIGIVEQWWQTMLLSVLREEHGLEPVREVTTILLQLLSPSPLAAEEDKLSVSARDSLIMALLHVYRGDCAMASLAEEPGARELKDNLENILIAYGGTNAKVRFI